MQRLIFALNSFLPIESWSSFSRNPYIDQRCYFGWVTGLHCTHCLGANFHNTSHKSRWYAVGHPENVDELLSYIGRSIVSGRQDIVLKLVPCPPLRKPLDLKHGEAYLVWRSQDIPQSQYGL